ncbi:MAG: hypothetical protein L3J83_06475 [Proteobacteria bacterium]|nr:hypothetical protein [Pseudomonadota bacterium]
MIKILLVLTLTTTHALALDLFKADYTVFKDGKQIGKSSMQLTKDKSFYTITDKTNGTHGMASLLGFKRSESTVFTETDGALIPESYQMQQKVAFNKKVSGYQIDRQIDRDKQQVTGSYKGDDWQLDTTDSFLTPNLVSLKLFNDICAENNSDLTYQVLKKGKLQTYNFTITSKKDNILEVDKIHSNPSRITKMWLDTNKQCLPIRTYHIQEGEDSLETKLVQLEVEK